MIGFVGVVVNIGTLCEKVFDARQLAIVGGVEELVVEVCLLAFLL